MKSFYLILAVVLIFLSNVDSQTKKPAATTVAPIVDPIDAITDNVIKWLFSFFPKKNVKALVNRLVTVVCDNNATDVTEIQRDLATQALLNGTVPQLTIIQQDIGNATFIWGADKYQQKIATFMNTIFEPFLIELPDIATTNYTDVKTCKSNVADAIKQSLKAQSAAAALKSGLMTLKPVCTDTFDDFAKYFPFGAHNITVNICGGILY